MKAQLTPEQSVRAMQVINFALVAGVMIFALIAVIGIGALEQPPAGHFVSLVAAAAAAMAFVMHLVVPNAIGAELSGGESGRDAANWYGVYQTRLIVALAILEGAAFFNLIATISEHNWWSLAIAGVLVFWMLIRFPTRTRVDQWVESQKMMTE
ncbi:MAG: hypothetical protein ACE5KM_22250 [Planctomycetaceae bacterium]